MNSSAAGVDRTCRRQVPVHLNGRRIRLTAIGPREIVEARTRRTNPIEATTPLCPARGKGRRSLPGRTLHS
jgi:hypothetical protein